MAIHLNTADLQAPASLPLKQPGHPHNHQGSYYHSIVATKHQLVVALLKPTYSALVPQASHTPELLDIYIS